VILLYFIERTYMHTYTHTLQYEFRMTSCRGRPVATEYIPLKTASFVSCDSRNRCYENRR